MRSVLTLAVSIRIKLNCRTSSQHLLRSRKIVWDGEAHTSGVNSVVSGGSSEFTLFNKDAKKINGETHKPTPV